MVVRTDKATGAVHIPYRGVVRVCKRMGIDYAEAVVGFEFGNRMAVPVIQGVVVAEEHHDKVIEELEKDEVERARKEDEKKRKLVLTTWRKFLVGLRVAYRIREDYAHLEETEGAVGRAAHKDKDWSAQMQEAEDEMRFRDENMAGGFLPEGFSVEEPVKKPPPPPKQQPMTSNYFANSQENDGDDVDPFEVDHGANQDQGQGGGFMPVDNDGDGHDAGGGGFMLEEDEDTKAELQEPEDKAPAVNGRRATRTLKKAAPKAKVKPVQKQISRRRSRRTKIEDTEDDGDTDNDDDDFLLGDSD